MNLLAAEQIGKSHGIKTLFKDISFGIEAGDKIGLIGVNGTGKSTFLQVIAGVEPPDQGEVVSGNQVRIRYLSQNPVFEPTATVLEQVFAGDDPVMQVLRAYEAAVAAAEAAPQDARLQADILRLSQQMDALDGWQLENEAKTILTHLGITDFQAIVGTLSGGQRKRIAMAGALIQPSELLILDEPTNHIDSATVAWLEGYLARRRGALLMVTHDRYFLDRVANRIIELDQGNLYSYQGNYSTFLERKAEREALETAAERKRQNLLRTELEWIRRGAKARTTKQKARIDRFEALQAQGGPAGQEKLEMVSGSTRLGRTVIELEGVSKQFDGKPVLAPFDYIVLRHDRVGIIGPNGTGKSTLLNLLAGVLEPDSGQLKVGTTVKIGYFSQENEHMDEAMRVIDYIREEAHVLPTADGGSITAAQLLERFLFPPAVQWTPIGKLSGGERRRLYLLRVLMSAPNVLLLDEPTNDLDIQTLSLLEEYLDDFAGAVVVVSHDRYFLDRVAETLFIFDEAGQITRYVGSYTEYCERQLSGDGEAAAEKPVTAKAVERPRERSRKFTFKEQKEYESIDAVIAETEAELQAIQAAMAGAGSDFVKLQELTASQQAIEQRLEELLERWTYLNELAEEIGLS